MKNKRGVRYLIISGMSPEQLIKFIRRKDSFYETVDLAVNSDEELRKIAHEVDIKAQEKRHRK